MEIIQPTAPIVERHIEENARATAEANRAAIDYNIMMGILEDPNEEEEGTEDE